MGRLNLQESPVSTVPKPKLGESDQKVEQRWGRNLTKAGWTAFPNIFFQRMQALGLDALDVVILLHLAGYKWGAGDPYPAKSTLAKAIGVWPRTVQRRIARMEKDGLIKRIGRKGRNEGSLTNQYNFDGLIEASDKFAVEHIVEIDRRRAENAARLSRRGPKKPLSVVGDK